MSTLVEKVEKELKIPKEQIREEGTQRFLEIEFKNLSIEILKLCRKHKINCFNDLGEKIERGEISESECFDDLTKLEYLETEKEKIKRLLQGAE